MYIYASIVHKTFNNNFSRSFWYVNYILLRLKLFFYVCIIETFFFFCMGLSRFLLLDFFAFYFTCKLILYIFKIKTRNRLGLDMIVVIWLIDVKIHSTIPLKSLGVNFEIHRTYVDMLYVYIGILSSAKVVKDDIHSFCWLWEGYSSLRCAEVFFDSFLCKPVEYRLAIYASIVYIVYKYIFETHVLENTFKSSRLTRLIAKVI